MKRFFLPAVALCVSIFALSLLMPAGAYAGGGHSNNNTSAGDETHMVIKVGDEYKVVTASRLKHEEKKVKDDYAQELKEWHDLKKTDPNAPALKSSASRRSRPVT